ncbi:hypothetical protein GCM10007425_08650 [Lysinibacillus alkalisoli]|uniref:HesB/YadR/YfhF family protein n=1 Tax=Lysinibacillus alkalisoli TaxID=1911548 RepID=A0A917G0Y9_9BACI|nr:HesB/YadR/YfhF family protein [Lysinibacillus alkalisoli]GGG16578.1 hypothetical protein GCM10007425_08650 [Lysinibacillus alkalisoli]
MQIIVTDEAKNWFAEEMEVETGDTIRFYARYGGSSPFHEGFSLGMTRDEPHHIGVKTVVDDITYFIEEDDLWFFNQHHLIVKVNEQLQELAYDYVETIPYT